jgi:hypothetical protein
MCNSFASFTFTAQTLLKQGLDLGTTETEDITTWEERAENVVTLFVHSFPHEREEGGGRRGRDVSSSLAA